MSSPPHPGESPPVDSGGEPLAPEAILDRVGDAGNGSGVADALPDQQARGAALPSNSSFRDSLLKRMLAFADALAALLATLSLALTTGEDPAATVFWAVIGLPLWLVLAKLHGLYDRDQRVLQHLTVDEVPSIVAWAVSGTATLTAALTLSPVGAPRLPAVVLALAVAAAAGALLRAGARSMWRATTFAEATLVVGSGRLAQATRRKIELFPDMHVRLVGDIDDASLDALRHAPERTMALATSSPGTTPVERLILASESLDEMLIAELVAVCRRRAIKLSVVPPARGMFGTAVRLSHVAELPLVEYNTWDAALSTLLLKRTLDLAIGVPALFALSPVLALIALAVRLDDPGPSFFRQRRAGLGGAEFEMLKFRTMVTDAEARLAEVGIDFEQLSDPMFKLSLDPRVTRLGRHLRRLSLDELPQLVNVVKGEMSLVGPRPEEVGIVSRYGEEARFRLTVKPGITGPMQVYGRGDLQFDERLAVEREYVENLSLGRDLKILAMTATPVLRGRGAY